MKAKDRVLAAIKFKGVDKIPATYKGLEPLTKKILKYFNIHYEGSMDAFAARKENRKKFLNLIGADFWSDGSRISKFTSFTPTYNGEPPKPPFVKEPLFWYTLGIGTILKRVDEYDYEYPLYTNPPLGAIESENDIGKDFLTKKLDLFDFKNYTNRVLIEEDVPDLSYQNSVGDDDFICFGTLNSIFMICCYLRGTEKFLLDLVCNKRLAEKIIDEVGQFCIEFNKRELAGFGSKAEFYCSFDDFAGQSGLLISPDLFKKYFLPLYIELIENVKKKNLIYTWHCCGSVHDILPHMIEAGIDVFNVCQTSARNMELEKVYKLYGSKVCIHGAIDVQSLLSTKTSKEVREEIKRIKELWSNNGGIIISPSHEALPETPVENILAIYESI